MIYNEDCLEGMKKLADDSVDAIICDLPFGSTPAEFDVALAPCDIWKQFKRVTKKNAAIVLFSQLPFACDLINANRKMFRYEWIWEKSLGVGFLNAKKMPLRCHENILVFYQQLPTYNPQFRKGKAYAHRSCVSSHSCYGYLEEKQPVQMTASTIFRVTRFISNHLLGVKYVFIRNRNLWTCSNT